MPDREAKREHVQKIVEAAAASAPVVNLPPAVDFELAIAELAEGHSTRSACAPDRVREAEGESLSEVSDPKGANGPGISESVRVILRRLHDDAGVPSMRWLRKRREGLTFTVRYVSGFLGRRWHTPRWADNLIYGLAFLEGQNAALYGRGRKQAARLLIPGRVLRDRSRVLRLWLREKGYLK